ncbi:MAG: acetyl-CoA C-acetyltransferase [Syntrophotaleaceae bacterium]
MPERVVLLSAVRTAIGRYGGSLREISAPRLGAQVVKEAVRRSGIGMEEVDEVIMGNVLSAGLGQNPARQAALMAGMPVGVGALTVNQVCGSGLQAVILATRAIRAGEARFVVAGGMESMSGAPHLLHGLRWGIRAGDADLVDGMLHDGLTDAFHGIKMGETGERIARKYGVTRQEADAFAVRSHHLAAEAQKSGKFDREIVAVPLETVFFARDECLRGETTMEKLCSLPPAFLPKGILTAGNSSQISDGAAALLLTSASLARDRNLMPLAEITHYASSGTAPEDVMESPIFAVRRLLERSGLTLKDMDLVEHNEAFSVASLAVARELGIDLEKLNVHGGAVALGHPIGASGARILVTLLHALQDRKLTRGLATLCMGGGNGLAMTIERTG